MESTISQAHSTCTVAFLAFIEALQSSSDHQHLDEAHDAFDRYRLWAGNMGAMHNGQKYRMSLDYRLREASFYKLQVLNLLNNLQGYLEKGALKIDEKKEIARYESALEDDGSSSSEDTGKDDSPWEVSSDSELEQSPTRKLSQKHLLRTNLTPQPPTSGLMTTAPLEYIKYVVDCLWRLPIRRPAPLDRMKRKTSADTSPYLPFDLMHVKEKFPNVEEIVAARLAKMISRRRQIIRYRKEHTETMQEKVSTSNVPAVHPIMQSYSRKGGEASEAAASFKTPSQRTENTKATTLRPGAPVATLMPQSGIYAPSVSESRSSTTSEQTAEDIPIKVPKRPKKKEGKALDHFICPYCSTAQFITSERKWKKHVLFDLQPYACTYPECQLHEYFFESREDWFNHESQSHRLEWFCNTEPHNAFSELSDFLEHMNIVHKESLGTNHALSLRRGFQRPSQGISGHCTLCGRQAKVLRSHLSRHLEQLALFAIPQTDYMADLEEEDAMSDVARQSFGASSDDECSSEHSAGTSIIADSGGGDDSGSPVTEKVSRGHEEEYEKQVPDLPEYLEEGVDTSWDIVTPKFQDARAAMYGSRSSGVDDVPSKFPVLTQAATSSQSPIGISQEKPLNPPPVPTLVLIPPDEHQTVGTSMVGPAQQPDTSPVRRLSLVKRASRFSDTILPSRNLLKNQDAPGSDESKIPQVPQASTGEHGDSTLHPFWRPRGFWDGFEDSDEEFQDDILPAGGDTSSEPEPKKEGWRNRLSSLVKKPGNFKESWAERRREKRRKELRKLINPQQL